MKISPYKIDSYIENIANNKDICAALVYGPEEGLVMIRNKKIARKIVPDANDPFLISNVNPKHLEEDKGLLNDEFLAIPMLGGRKLINISNVGNKITQALDLIFVKDKKQFVKPKGDNFILVTAGHLDSNSSLRKLAQNNPYIACLACYEDDRQTTVRVIKQKLGDLRLGYDDQVVEFFLDQFGKNRLIIFNELEKLALFVNAGQDKNSNGKKITIDIVKQVVADISQISVGEFVNYFADLDLKNSLYCLERIFAEKISPIVAIRFLANYFLKLKLVHSKLKSGASLDSQLRVQKIFFKQEILFKKHLRLWSEKAIDSILLKLQELELKSKISGSNSQILLSSFVNFVYLRYNPLK